MYRVEDKNICSRNDLILIENRIKNLLCFDDNQDGENGYVITSVYFDDLFNTCLHDNEDGVVERCKYRIRIYNYALSCIKLEVKSKIYNRIQKQSQKISLEEMKNFLLGRCVKDEYPSLENPITLFNLAIKERGLRPVVIVEYNRSAYVYESGNVRITFDRNVRKSSQVERFGERGLYMELVKGASDILEVKYDELLPDFIAQLLEMGNMNRSSFSKYKVCSLV